jgi:hypothetical protein
LARENIPNLERKNLASTAKLVRATQIVPAIIKGVKKTALIPAGHTITVKACLLRVTNLISQVLGDPRESLDVPETSVARRLNKCLRRLLKVAASRSDSGYLQGKSYAPIII